MAESTLDIEPAEDDDHRWYHRRTSLRFRMIHWLSRLTKGRIHSPHVHAAIAYHRAHDAQENAESKALADERCESWIVWAVEAYTPSNIAGLLDGLDRLAKQKVPVGERDPAGWVRRQRRNPGGSLELYLTNKGERGISTGFEVELPSFASYAQGTISMATPSLTLLTMAFYLSDGQRRVLDDILHGDQVTRAERSTSHSTYFHSPQFERNRLARECRSAWEREGGRWFLRYFPGLFGTSAARLPTAELTVLAALVPFERSSDRRKQNVLRTLAVDSATTLSAPDASKAGPVFAPFGHSDDEGSRHMIVAMTDPAFHGLDVQMYGDGPRRHAHHIDRSYRKVITQWSLRTLIEHYRERIASARDNMVHMVGPNRALRALDAVRQITSECADAHAVARDLEDGLDKGTLHIHGAGLVLRAEFDGDKIGDHADILRDTLRDGARALLTDVAELDRTLHAQAALLSARANLRLQPAIIALAIISAVAGALAAVGPAKDLIDLFGPPPESCLIQKSRKFETVSVNPPTPPTPPSDRTTG